MKRIITLLALIAIASAAHAQTDSLVVFDTQGDKLGISVAGFNITLGENGSEQKSSKPKVKRVTTNFLGITFGYNVLTYKPNYGNWASEQNFMTDNTHGMRLGLEPFSIQVSLDRKQTVFLRVAMNSYVENYRFKSPMTLINDENGNLMPQDIGGTVKKSRISASYSGLCAGLGFKISRLMFMFDFNADLLSKSVAMYKNPKKTLYDISGFNNIRYRVGASATVNGFGIYVDYCLTPLFREGVGNDGNVTSIGIRWGF